MAPIDGSDKEARKNNSPQHTDKADVTIGPYRNDLFTEILLDKTKYIKNCFFYFMRKKAYFPNLASMDSAEINQWIKDLSQIVKTRICELIIYDALSSLAFYKTSSPLSHGYYILTLEVSSLLGI